MDEKRPFPGTRPAARRAGSQNASPHGTPLADHAWDSGVSGGAVCICSRTAPFPPYPSLVRHGCASKRQSPAAPNVLRAGLSGVFEPASVFRGVAQIPAAQALELAPARPGVRVELSEGRASSKRMSVGESEHPRPVRHCHRSSRTSQAIESLARTSRCVPSGGDKHGDFASMSAAATRDGFRDSTGSQMSGGPLGNSRSDGALDQRASPRPQPPSPEH